MNEKNQLNASGVETPGDVPATGASLSDTANAAGPKKKGMLIGLIVALLVVLLAGGLWFMMQGKEEPVVKKTVKIGFMAPLSGTYTSMGQVIQRGITLAQQDLRQQLEEKGVTVELVVKETTCEADPAAKAMNELVAENVVAVIGEVCSRATLAAAPIANEHKIPLISPASTSPDVTAAGEYVFRVIPSDALAGDVVAAKMYGKGYHKLAIIYSDESYGKGLNTSVSEAFKKLGGTVVASEGFQNQTADFSGQLNRIKAASPDVLFIGASDLSSAAAIILKRKDLGMSGPVYGAESLKDASFLSDAGAAAEGVNIIAASEGTTRFIEAYRAAYEADPGVYSAQSYDCFQALALALLAGAQTGETIKNQLDKSDFAGVSGQVKFDANGDVPGNYTIFTIKDGKFRATAD